MPRRISTGDERCPDARGRNGGPRRDRQSDQTRKVHTRWQIIAIYIQTFVFAQISGSRKHAVVISYIQSTFVIRLYGSDGMLLLAVQIQRNLIQIEMLEIKRITLCMTVECLVGHESSHKTRGSCPENNFS